MSFATFKRIINGWRYWNSESVYACTKQIGPHNILHLTRQTVML